MDELPDYTVNALKAKIAHWGTIVGSDKMRTVGGKMWVCYRQGVRLQRDGILFSSSNRGRYMCKNTTSKQSRTIQFQNTSSRQKKPALRSSIDTFNEVRPCSAEITHGLLRSLGIFSC